MTKKETIEAALRAEGCLGKAADDEPVFVLRAADMLAPHAIREWADRLEQHYATHGLMTSHVLRKVSSARRLALQMDSYPNRKLPD